MFSPRLTTTFHGAGRPFIHKSILELITTISLRPFLRALVAGAILLTPASALAATCGTGSFDAWLAEFKTEAAAKGISQSAIATGLAGVTLDQSVLSRDRGQKVFQQSF